MYLLCVQAAGGHDGWVQVGAGARPGGGLLLDDGRLRTGGVCEVHACMHMHARDGFGFESERRSFLFC